MNPVNRADVQSAARRDPPPSPSLAAPLSHSHAHPSLSLSRLAFCSLFSFAAPPPLVFSALPFARSSHFSARTAPPTPLRRHPHFSPAERACAPGEREPGWPSPLPPSHSPYGKRARARVLLRLSLPAPASASSSDHSAWLCCVLT